MRIVSRAIPLAVSILAVAVAVSVSGCGKQRLASCKQDDKDYAGARELPPLKAPPGLESPDTRNALKVPGLQTPERRRGKDEPCLDYPPPFATPKASGTAPASPAPAPRQPREVPTE